MPLRDERRVCVARLSGRSDACVFLAALPASSTLARTRPFVEENTYIRSFDATYRDLLCSAEADSKVDSRIIGSELFELKEEKKLPRSMVQQD